MPHVGMASSARTVPHRQEPCPVHEPHGVTDRTEGCHRTEHFHDRHFFALLMLLIPTPIGTVMLIAEMTFAALR